MQLWPRKPQGARKMVKGFCEGWSRPSHVAETTRKVITPTHREIHLCNRCIQQVERDVMTGWVLGTFQVIDESGVSFPLVRGY